MSTNINQLLVKYGQYIGQCCLKGIYLISVKQNMLTLIFKKQFLLSICFFLKNHSNTRFKILLDIVVIDKPSKRSRFEIIYVLLDVFCNKRLLIKTRLTALSSISSVVFCYSSSGWFEREVWDLFGIFFENNFDLRRILTDYGFEGHPFRKEFPLSGYVELRYDENQKRIVSEFLEVSQEFRHFDFS